MTSRDGQQDDGIPVFRIDDEEIVDLASLLGDDSASGTSEPAPKSEPSKASDDFSSMRQSAIASAAESLAASLEGGASEGGAFDDAVTALIYGSGGDASPKPPVESAAKAPPKPPSAPAPRQEPVESVDSNAGNVFKVDLDGLDDFEALLKRTMGEAAGLGAAPPVPEIKPPPAEKAPAKQISTQWRKPDKPTPERGRRDEPSEESKAVDELRKKVKEMTSETESYRRRLKDEAKAARGKGREDVFKALMPIMDALDMALKSTTEGAGSDDQLIKGIQLVQKQLNTDLGLLGLELIAPMGDTFDPTIHEAFQQVVTGKVQPGQVAEVVRNGYRFEEKLLRPAQVLVEKA